MAWHDTVVPVPKKNVEYTLVFPIYKTDGTLITSAAGLDSEIYIDGAAVADCSNEATEIGQGVYYLVLTATEMTCNSAAVIVKTSSADAVRPVFALAPEEAGDIRANVTQINSDAALIAKFAAAVGGNLVGTLTGSQTGTTLTASTPAAATADLYNGRFLLMLSGGLAGKATKITDYAFDDPNGVFTVDSLGSGPTAGDTFLIL